MKNPGNLEKIPELVSGKLTNNITTLECKENDEWFGTFK